MDPISIRELRQAAGAQPESFLFHAQLERVIQKMARNGKPFYEIKLADAGDSLVLRAWNDTAAFSDCAAATAGGFYAVAGQFFLNAEHGSIDGRDFSLKPLPDEAVESLLAGSGELRERQAADYADIERMVSGIADPRLRTLGEAFLDKFGERMRRTGAARRNHHARRGGLVEHVAQMMRTAVQVCVAYPALNRDLLVSGALLHDIGKLWENAYAPEGFTMPYTETSELISHIPIGMEIVNRLWHEIEAAEAASAWRELDPDSNRVRLHLLHLIASHHGSLEFGSPVVPKTPEAVALHYIDNLDAKLQMMAEAYEKAPELGKNVFEKQWPLPGNLVWPLDRFQVPAMPEDFSEAGKPEVEPGDLLPIPEPDFGAGEAARETGAPF